MPTYSTEFPSDLKARDINDILSTLIARQPTFISLFADKGVASQRKHEWNEDLLKPKSVAYSSATAVGVFTFASTATYSLFEVGDYVRMKNSAAMLKITAIDTTNHAITTSFVNANGSGLTSSTIPTAAGTMLFVSHPVVEGSTSGLVSSGYTGVNYNCVQIYRRDVSLTRTAESVDIVGRENTLEAQINKALLEISRELNETALFGVRADRQTTSDVGGCGGLYYFASQYATNNEINATIDGTAAKLSTTLINDAAQKILDAGGTPNVVACNPGQKRVLATLLQSQIVLQPQDEGRGGTVNYLYGDITGGKMRIVVDDAIPETDVWVLDSTGFGKFALKNEGRLHYLETQGAVDAKSKTVLGEFTLEFKNAASRLARIKGLKKPAEALA